MNSTDTRWTYFYVKPAIAPPFTKTIRSTRGQYTHTTEPVGCHGFRYAVFRRKASELLIPWNDLTPASKATIQELELLRAGSVAPWQMTASEFKAAIAVYEDIPGKWRVTFPATESQRTGCVYDRATTSDPIAKTLEHAFHKDFIRKALRNNKPVPAAVLADYPDLSPTTPNGPATSGTTLTEPNGGAYGW